MCCAGLVVAELLLRDADRRAAENQLARYQEL